jgi:hypothetical protein
VQGRDCLSSLHAKKGSKNGHPGERVWITTLDRWVVYCSQIALPHEVTGPPRESANGTQSALDALTPLVYGELRRLAASYLRSEAGHTLQPTALVGSVAPSDATMTIWLAGTEELETRCFESAGSRTM